MRLLHFVETIAYVKWLFPCSPTWAKAGFRVILKDFEFKKLDLWYRSSNIKQIDSMLPLCLLGSSRNASSAGEALRDDPTCVCSVSFSAFLSC